MPESLLYPSGYSFGHVLNYIFVAPLTVITPLNLVYQIYLMEIFHTNFLYVFSPPKIRKIVIFNFLSCSTRGMHFIMMPLVTWSYLLFAAQFDLPFVSSSTESADFSNHIPIFSIRLNAVVALCFGLWWLYWGIKSKVHFLGVC